MTTLNENRPTFHSQKGKGRVLQTNSRVTCPAEEPANPTWQNPTSTRAKKKTLRLKIFPKEISYFSGKLMSQQKYWQNPFQTEHTTARILTSCFPKSKYSSGDFKSSLFQHLISIQFSHTYKQKKSVLKIITKQVAPTIFNFYHYTLQWWWLSWGVLLDFFFETLVKKNTW